MNTAFIEFEELYNILIKDVDFISFLKKENNNLLSKDSEEYNYNYGATKVCFWLDEGEWVFKVDLRDVSYCRIEYENYIKAVENGLEDYFAECFPIKKINGTIFYAMERAYVNEDHNSETLYNNMIKAYGEEETEDFFEDSDSQSEGEELISYYIDDFGKFIDFCQLNNINDLHIGNIGFKNGQLKIIDYSGY